MKRFWHGIQGDNPFILGACIVLLIFTYVNFNYSNDIQQSERSEVRTLQQTEMVKRAILENAIKKEIESNDSKLKLVVDYMVDKIRVSYQGRYQNLEKDFLNPDSDKALYSILNEGISRLNIEEEVDSKYIITSRYSILTKYKTSTTDGKTDRDSIQLLSYVTKNYKHMMDRNISSVVINVNTGTEEDMSQVINGYASGNKASNYFLLIPTYITSEGDIFGIPDFNSLGEPQKNYRLMVIKVVRMSEVTDDLQTVTKEVELLSDTIEREHADARIAELQRRVFSSIFLLMAAIGVLMYVQHSKLTRYTKQVEKEKASGI